MSDHSPMYHCLCGWTGPTLPTDAWICPECGRVVGATTIAMETPEVGARAQFVFSRSQIVEQPFPPTFWEGMTRRVMAGELYIDPRDLPQWLLPSISVTPPRRSRGGGRPSGPVYATTKEEFEGRLFDMFLLLEKDGPRASKARVAQALDISVGTLNNYCKDFEIDYWEVQRRAREITRR